MSATRSRASRIASRAQLAPDERVAAGGAVALVEDEVEDGEHAVEPLRQEVVRGHPVGDAGVADLPLGPHDPLGERGLRDEERPGDLWRREAAEGAQRQRHPRVERERRVAAGEDEPQAIVGEAALASQAHGRLRSRGHEAAFDLDELLGVPAGPAQPVERPVAGRRRDPRPRVGGDPVAGPRLQGRDERVGHGLLGGIEVAAEEADERRQGAAGLVAEGPLDA